MRFIVLVKADKNSEAGQMPDEKLLTEMGKYNEDLGSKLFFQLSARFGNNIYNFKGLSFNKSKYRGQEKPVYWASNSLLPSNDVYLAFLSADITRSYFSTLGRLIWGMLTAAKNGKSE